MELPAGSANTSCRNSWAAACRTSTARATPSSAGPSRSRSSPTAGCGSRSQGAFPAGSPYGRQLPHENIVGIYDFGEDTERPVHGDGVPAAARTCATPFATAASGDMNQLKIALQSPARLHTSTPEASSIATSSPRTSTSTRGRGQADGFRHRQDRRIFVTHAGTCSARRTTCRRSGLGRERSPQVDVYAYGVLLFELFTTRKPFTAERSRASSTTSSTSR